MRFASMNNFPVTKKKKILSSLESYFTLGFCILVADVME